MKRERIVGAVVLATLLTLAMPADAEEGSGVRSVTDNYSAPVIGTAWPSYQMHDCGVFILPLDRYLVQGCSTPRIKAGENFVSVRARDLTGLPVSMKVFQWAAGLGGTGSAPRYVGKDACGEMAPWKLKPWATYMWIEVLAGPCSDGTPAFATSGTVTTTFHKEAP